MKIADYKNERVHMIGIGGSSMSGLAEMLVHRGYHVSGSDNALSHTVERLRDHGIAVQIGHRPENVRGAGVIVYSAAIAEDNPERAEAKRLGIPYLYKKTDSALRGNIGSELAAVMDALKFAPAERILDLDIHIRFKSGKANHIPGQIVNFDRLTHIQNKNLTALGKSSRLKHQ